MSTSREPRAMHTEVTFHKGADQKPAAPSLRDSPTMKRGATDGINKAIPTTNSTKAPGQWGRS